MNEIQLSLTIDEINKILESLGNRPYAEVFQLIINIQQQAESQLQSAAPTEPDTPDE